MWRGPDRSAPRGSAPSSAQELGVGGGQQPGQALGPLPLAGRVDYQILTDLDLDMRQAAPLAMHWDRIVGLVADLVRLIFADHQVPFGAQQFCQLVCEPPIAVE